MIKRLFDKAKDNKKSGFALLAAMMVMFIATSAGAATPTADADTVAAVSAGMGGIQKTALAVVAAVAGVAVLLFAAPFAWQYGKKIFKTVSR